MCTRKDRQLAVRPVIGVVIGMLAAGAADLLNPFGRVAIAIVAFPRLKFRQPVQFGKPGFAGFDADLEFGLQFGMPVKRAKRDRDLRAGKVLI